MLALLILEDGQVAMELNEILIFDSAYPGPLASTLILSIKSLSTCGGQKTEQYLAIVLRYRLQLVFQTFRVYIGHGVFPLRSTPKP